MDFSYDYLTFLEEIKEELTSGTLNEADKISILRSKKSYLGYYPIIDWYYEEETLKSIFSTDSFDSPSERKEKKILEKQYNKTKQFLVEVKVSEFIKELKLLMANSF